MKRWYLFYLAAVVLPLCLGIWATAYLSSGEVERLRFEEDRRIAETGAALLRRDISVAQGSGQPLEPSFLSILEGAGGYEAALYVDGVKSAATGADPGPDTLPARIHRRLALFPRGQAYISDDAGGALYPLDVASGTAPEVVVFAAPAWTRPPTLPTRMLKIATGFGILLVLLGWWAFQHRSPSLRRRSILVTTLVWVLLPLTMAWCLVFFMARGFQDDARERSVRELARSLAIIRSEGDLLPPSEARLLTGFDVTLLGPEGIAESTLVREGARQAIASIRPPPAAFTITGRVGDGDDESVYVASRPRSGETLVLSYPRPGSHPRALGLRLIFLAIGMGAFSALFPIMMLRERAVERALERAPPAGPSGGARPAPRSA